MLYDEEGNPYVEPPLLPEEQHLAYIVKDYQRMYRKCRHLEQKVERLGENNTRISNLNYSQFRIIFEYAKGLKHCIEVMQKNGIRLSPYMVNIIQPMLKTTFDIVNKKQKQQ